MSLDEKTTHTKGRIERLNRSLKCCSWAFFLFGLMMFGSAVSTFYGAKFNAAHIAETGYLPWGPSKIDDFTPSQDPVKYEFDLYNTLINMAVTMIFSTISLFLFMQRTMIARWCQKASVSRNAFRRTLYCMAIYFIINYFMKNQVKTFMDLYKKIAEEKNATIPDGVRRL